MQLSSVWYLLKKEAVLEWRERSTFAGMLLYAIGASFIVYFSFQGDVTFKVWAANFWMIALFTCIHALSRSFFKEANEQFYYIRSVVKPIDLLLSKLLYNALLIFVFELIIYIEMSLFFGIEIKDKTSFLLTLFFGGMGMSNLFTLLSAITAKTGNVVLLAVLGFPIILPLLLLVLRLTGILDVALLEGDINVNLGAVIVLDMITMVMAIVLFPYLWKD